MAASQAVWGIDLGQSALKALRCRPHEDPTRAIADAFDYIEYPKILTQPEADPIELIQDALDQFLSRNSLKGDRVAISVPGQAGLARFIKLPPVESKKIPDIVKYEARQQIPFPLEEVVWDYQQMDGSAEEEGFALETEVGLFAMKRDQVFRALKPLDDAGIEVDFVQLAPLALYNFCVFDQMRNLPPPEEFDPEDPPDSVVMLSLGTDTTDLVVSNGFRVWQRNIPIGGNHFTKALSKELKLTFGKAEHLKKNAKQADDPKAIFRAMRPVFNDLLTEIQRSLGYFTSIDRNAKITRMVGLGNAMKLPALDRFIAQNLGYEVAKLGAYSRLSGSSVVEAPAFKDNVLSFATCYGLALQGVCDVRLKTNLMPPEVLTDRMIRDKKPWALAAVASLLVGLSISFFGQWKVWNAVQDDYTVGDVSFKQAKMIADQASSQGSQFTSQMQEATTQFGEVDAGGMQLIRSIQNQLQWLEVYKALNACLPFEPPPKGDAVLRPIHERNQLHITAIQCSKVSSLAPWWKNVRVWPPFYYKKAAANNAAPPGGQRVAPGAPGVPGDPGAPGGAVAAPDAGPTGPGWVFRLVGHHFHNADAANRGADFVLNTLIANLNKTSVRTPDGDEVAVGDIGVGYAVLINPQIIDKDFRIVNPDADVDEDGKGGGDPDGDRKINLPKFSFEIQLCWMPKSAEKPQGATPPGELAAAGAGRTN